MSCGSWAVIAVTLVVEIGGHPASLAGLGACSVLVGELACE